MPVVDASVVVDWVAPGAGPDSASGLLLQTLTKQSAELLGPTLLLQEVANTLLTGIRTRGWSSAEADLAYHRLLALPIRVVDDERDTDRAWELARRYDNHPMYDMVYLALAERFETQFMTRDRSLLKHLAHHSLVVSVE